MFTKEQKNVKMGLSTNTRKVIPLELRKCTACMLEKELNEDNFKWNTVKGKKYFRYACRDCMNNQRKTYNSGSKEYRQKYKGKYHYPDYVEKTHAEREYFTRVAKNINSRARSFNLPDKITREELETHLGRHDENVCYLCGGELEDIGRQFRSAQIDHKHSLKKGGKNTIGNITWVHCFCNRMKNHLTTSEFLDHCKRIIEFNK